MQFMRQGHRCNHISNSSKYERSKDEALGKEIDGDRIQVVANVYPPAEMVVNDMQSEVMVTSLGLGRLGGTYLPSFPGRKGLDCSIP